MERDIFAASVELATLRAERAVLVADRLRVDDPAYLVILAREKLGYIFPGEKKCVRGEISPDALPAAETPAAIGD